MCEVSSTFRSSRLRLFRMFFKCSQYSQENHLCLILFSIKLQAFRSSKKIFKISCFYRTDFLVNVFILLPLRTPERISGVFKEAQGTLTRYGLKKQNWILVFILEVYYGYSMNHFSTFTDIFFSNYLTCTNEIIQTHLTAILVSI